MIVEKHPLPDDATPVDAPPSYQAVVETSQFRPSNDKHTAASSSSSSTSAPAATSPNSSAPPSSPSTLRAQQPRNRTWSLFNPQSAAEARTAKEVHATVLGLLRDLVKRHAHLHAAADGADADAEYAAGILASCSAACTAHGLAFPAILQEKSIEGHTPLYWAVVKRPSPSDTTHSPDPDAAKSDLVARLLALSRPLTPSTISDLRLACLVAADAALFQRLHRTATFAAPSGTDTMLLGCADSEDIGAADTVVVDDARRGDEGAFVARIEIMHFQRRMRVSGEVTVEFIARGRIWILAFFVVPNPSPHPSCTPGAWAIALRLGEHSPPTWMDARIVIADSSSLPTPVPSSVSAISASSSSSSSTTLIDAPSSTSTYPPPRRLHTPARAPASKPKPKPTISLRLKTLSGAQLTAAPSPESTASSAKSYRRAAPPPTPVPSLSAAVAQGNISYASLDESLMGAGLQYDGCAYITHDGTLHTRLDARLAKPEAECIIC